MRTLLSIILIAASSATAQPSRPQTPVAPFPYEQIGVTIPVQAESGDAHTLSGTLTIPDASVWGNGPHPGLVLVTGSGPQDRDETIFDHKPFMVIADYLSRRGVAVLRYDDRGIGESTGSFASASVRGLAHDAEAAWSFLRDHESTDPARVGICGHSEGGLIAPMVAADQKDEGERVAFLVLLAGTGSPGSEIVLFQTEQAFRSMGQTEEWIADNTARRRAIYDLLEDGADDETVFEAVAHLMDMELSHLNKPEDRRRAARQVAPQFTGAWIREFLTIDPREALLRVEVPVLALNGTLDTQVTIEQNLDHIEAALGEGACPSATIVRLKGLNHLFQPALTGLLGEYATIETTFDEGTLGLIAGWISATTGLDPTPVRGSSGPGDSD